jgi:hypothetical protein
MRATVADAGVILPLASAMRVTAPCPTALRSRGSHIGCHAPASLCARSAFKCKTALPRRGVNSPAATDASSSAEVRET